MTLNTTLADSLLHSLLMKLFLLSLKNTSFQCRNKDLLCWLEHSLGGAIRSLFTEQSQAQVTPVLRATEVNKGSLLTFNEEANLMSCTTLYHFPLYKKKQKLFRTVTTELCILSLSGSQIKLLHCVYKTIKCELDAKLCHCSVARN